MINTNKIIQKMITVKINNLEFLVKENISVLEACKYVGITIPRFCYHETLSIAGNCRMCLVEIEKTPKPVSSCTLPVSNQMQIYVDTPLVKKSRENIIETLLLNHPLDCPICDQGGECDLQDQTKLFGSDYSRFFLGKRGVEDKSFGPLIKTIMTRCIHCTRCVRFGTEIAGVDYLGTLNRGTSTEISGYISKMFNSEISGNVIDLCPVGALTSMPYTFKARPWELRSNESIDLTDSLGSNIYVHFKDSEVLRILPKNNNYINENLISDKARFYYDSIKNQRLQKIFEKSNKDRFDSVNWTIFLKKIKSAIHLNTKIEILINDELDLESIKILKKVANFSDNITVKAVSTINCAKNNYISWQNNKVLDLNKSRKVCFLISTNTRIESAILNTKIRNKTVNELFKVICLGQNFNSSFGMECLNLNLNKLLSVFEANSKISTFLISSKNPLICFGDTINKRFCGNFSTSDFLKKIAPTNILFSIKKAANSKGLEYLNIQNLNSKSFKDSSIIFAINLEDNIHLRKLILKTEGQIFWFNTHGSNLAKHANFIIPTSNEFESEKSFINLEERAQKTLKSINSFNDIRNIKNIITALYPKISIKEENSCYKFLKEIINQPEKFNKNNNIFSKKNIFNSEHLKALNYIYTYPIKSSLEDFYQSNNSTKNSITMSKCSQWIRKNFNNFKNI